eukprot:Nitzschia sp. Nitz4//scaffold20_size174350//160042//170970//NITZ4_002134-RA/size174350-augustus-gene-0.39-mRNA-1//1//CDS//3329541905//4161//frame0
MVQPISAPSLTGAGIWRPVLSVTVIAVYPLGTKAETSLLVRGYRVDSAESAKTLCDQIDKWLHSEVEVGIGERLTRPHDVPTWSMPLYSSSLRDILQAADYALSLLSNDARPLIVVATDGRSVSCDGVSNVFLDIDRVDVPVTILDISLPETHVTETIESQASPSSETEWNFLTYDPGGPSDFPLHLSDDTRELYHACKATGGCFLDLKLLRAKSLSRAGDQLGKETPGASNQSYRVRYPDSRRTIGFDLSPPAKKSHHHSNRSTFATYVVMPVRIKALLSMRIKEGYRAKQYIGLSTKDTEKVLIQFTLPLERGTVLHYELSYKALPNRNHVVGSANVKIELSGDPVFVQTVKNDFLRQGQEIRPVTMTQKISARLCKVMKWIRQEDILQSNLCPPQTWSDHFILPNAPFCRMLDSMESLQRRRHFRSYDFDVICIGNMPYVKDDEFLSEFASTDSGELELMELLNSWASPVVEHKNRKFVKTSTSHAGYSIYCLVEIRQSALAKRLFTISLEFFGDTDPTERLLLLDDLFDKISQLKCVEILGKQMGPYIVDSSQAGICKMGRVEFENHFATWDLVKDTELLPLVMKRRTEIGGFRLLQSTKDVALFAKIVPEELHDIPGDMVQYQIAILPDRVVVSLHMEVEMALLFPFSGDGEAKQFSEIVKVLRRRDQECGRALRSRTNLLNVIQGIDRDHIIQEDHIESVKRMLQYSSRVSRKLRFFSSVASGANDVLSRITESLLSSGSFGVKAAKLDIDCLARIGDEDEGYWFVVQYDRHTMSMVHLSVVDKVDENKDWGVHTYRDLTFYTSGISDLYSKRDDKDDDDSVDSHISEYMCVTEFAEKFEAAENDNFASAAYLALRDNSSAIRYFDTKDFDIIQDSLEYVEVASLLVSGHGHGFEDVDALPRDRDTKLTRLIGTILSPVPGADAVLYYSGTEILDETFGISEDTVSLDTDDVSSHASTDSLSEFHVNSLIATNQADHTTEREGTMTSFLQPPIFVRFKIDGRPVPFEKLNDIDRSSTLSAEISILREKTDVHSTPVEESPPLPWTHQAVAAELNVLLKWYVAEQTIERLRHLGPSSAKDHFDLVRKCMKRVKTVFSSSIEVFFYVSKSDMLVPASAPAGGESEVEEGFVLLAEAFKEIPDFSFEPAGGGCFLVYNRASVDTLDFWCFVYVQPSDGLVLSQIYHPGGEEVAVNVVSNVQRTIRSSIHKVNQELMLKSLHINRSVTRYILASAPTDDTTSDENHRTLERFSAGSFACPVVFRRTFALFHRCATNPNQVAHSLEATVLHSFAVSNKPGLFVYKDEVGAIFYMTLEARGSGIDGDGSVELLVYGIRNPGPSITFQLSALLQRRLMIIAVEMLSAVLTKNPHFRVSGADLDFLRSFNHEWPILEKETSRSKNDECYFEFPDFVYDPCMVILMFRQNLCGSTFFHRLNDIGDDKLSPAISFSHALANGGSVLKWNEHEFTLYYNNTPSKLDQTFQGVSTLTEKGARLSQVIGSGIAVVEIALVKANGTPLDEVNFAQPATTSALSGNFPENAMFFTRLKSFPTNSDKVCVRVRVTDTGLSREHLHEWLELTLNQALLAWFMERGIECYYAASKENLDSPIAILDTLPKANNSTFGLSALSSVLAISNSLPHPAVSSLEGNGVIRSTGVSARTLDLLKGCILGVLFPDLDQTSLLLKAKKYMKIIRISKTDGPSIVNLSRDQKSKRLIVRQELGFGQSRQVEDSPIDSPEYICFFLWSSFNEEDGPIDSALQLYQEVMINDAISDRSPTIDRLRVLKEQNRRAFTRSFAFILSVSRNQRSLKTYNWNPNLLKSLSIRFRDSEAQCLDDTGRYLSTMQFRTLRLLSPPTKVLGVKIDQGESSPKQPQKDQPQTPNDESESTVREGVTRRIRRPTVMRRPKLVGKSVEGAAMQAVAASRKRASSNQFKNIGATAGSRRTGGVTGSRDAPRSAATKAGLGPGSSASESRRELTMTKHAESKTHDQNYQWVRNDFSMMVRFRYWKLRRMSARSIDAAMSLTNLWWPRKVTETIPASVADFITSKSPLTWSDECVLPTSPSTLGDFFLSMFARWITTFTPGLQVVHTSPPTSHGSSIFLVSDVKNVHSSKCFCVVRISKVDWDIAGKQMSAMTCRGWGVYLPRRKQKCKLKRAESRVMTAHIKERDATGLDKLTTDTHNLLFLESLVFDFNASLVERAIRLADEWTDKEELIPMMRCLMSQWPLEKQKRMPRLNYRLFEARLILKSFQNAMINKSDGNSLLLGMISEAEERDLISCGEGVCFKKVIAVKGCQYDATTKNGCSVQEIPPGSTVLVDGNGLAFHLMKVAYAKHTRSVAKTGYCPEVGSFMEADICKIIPIMLPMSVMRAVAKEFVASIEGRGLLFRFCWGNPSQRIPYVEEKARRQGRLETWDAMRRFCNNGVFPLRLTDSCCRCLDTFPLPRIFLKVVRLSLIKAKLDILDLDGDVDREISELAQGDQSIFVLGCNSDYLFYKDIQYIPFQGLFIPKASNAPMMATVLTRGNVATGCGMSESKWVELSLVLGNKFVDRNSLQIPSHIRRADHAIAWLLRQAEGFQVLSKFGNSAIVFARAMYNLDSIDAFPVDETIQTTPEERTQMEIRDFLGIPDIPLSKVKIESKIKHLVLHNLREYVKNPEFVDNEGLRVLAEEHFSAYHESLKLDSPLSDISYQRLPQWFLANRATISPGQLSSWFSSVAMVVAKCSKRARSMPMPAYVDDVTPSVVLTVQFRFGEVNDYRQHTSCITEAERYEGKLAKPAKRNPQQEWMDVVMHCTETAPSHLKHYVQTMAGLDNIPRKEKQFRNFTSNSLNLRGKSGGDIVGEIWNVLKQEREKRQEAKQAARNESKQTKSVEAPTPAKDTDDGSDDEDEAPKAKTSSHKKAQKATEDSADIDKKSVHKAMTKALKKAPKQSMKLKELRRLVEGKLGLPSSAKKQLKKVLMDAANMSSKKMQIKIDGKMVSLV